MLQQFGDAIGQFKLTPSHRLLLAVSGGVDSMSLLHLAEAVGLHVAVAHVNFKLRGAESNADQALVEAYCQERNIPCFVNALPISKENAKNGVQAEARRLRYAWFDELMNREGFDFLLTAHHRDDTIETFFMHLLRGAGIKGLRAIPQKNGYLIRPMLHISQAEILAYARSHDVPWREDASNAEDAYLRNKIRHGLVPDFQSLAPNALENLTKSIGYLAETDRFLEKAGADFIESHIAKGEKGVLTISFHDAAFLWDYPALGKYVFDLLGFEPNQLHQASQLKDSQSGKGIDGSRYRMIRDRDGFVFAPIDTPELVEITLPEDRGMIEDPIKFVWEPRIIGDSVPPSGRNIAVLDAARLRFPLKLRRWVAGDRFVPLGMKGSKKLSDFLIDEKCSIAEKEQVWVLVSAGEICWVVGYRIDERFKLGTETSEAIWFTYE